MKNEMRLDRYDLWIRRYHRQGRLHKYIKVYYRKIRRAVKQALKRGDEEMPVIKYNYFF